jgi:cation transport protein ChaC
MTLSRRDLEEDRMRSLYMAAVDPRLALSDEALAESLAATLARRPSGAGWWVFAYGSLLWNPLFPFAEARPATLRGVHRSFCLWSKASRGTCDEPGLVLGLEPGGACRGVVYRLPPQNVKAELALLWRREMVTGAYRARERLSHSRSSSTAHILNTRAGSRSSRRRRYWRAQSASSARRRITSSTRGSP